MLKNKQGFTLIELLVVISIIACLTTVSVFVINDARIKSRNTKRAADAITINKAINLYINETGHAPNNASDGEAVLSPGNTSCYGTVAAQCCLQTGGTNPGQRMLDRNSISAVPVDPKCPTTQPLSVSNGVPTVDPTPGCMCYYYNRVANTTNNYQLSYYLEKDAKNAAKMVTLTNQ